MKLIILNIAAYKEKDAVVTGLGETGLTIFRVPGLFSPKSQFTSINNVLSIIEPTFNEAKTTRHLILKEVELLFSPLTCTIDAHTINCLAILIEATNKLIEDEEKKFLYHDLFNALLAVKNKINPYLIALKYLISLLNATGFELNVNRCVRCGGKQGIVAFSFLEGGFICKNCFTNEDRNDLDINEMKAFRNIYLFNGYAFTENYDEKIIVSLLKKINIFITDAYGSTLKAINNI